MPFPVGTTLGPYEIVAAIGAGGMGEVYRARDTRLNRTVAVKVLPDHIAHRASSRQRFEREAKVIAALNHAHICQIFDVGHQDGADYLVMEFIEGETLSQRLKRGPIPPHQVVQYAIQIAEALDQAHRRGVVHRDLKPGNVMLTKNGVKVLDFGLAKVKEEGSTATAGDPSAFSTETSPLTQESVTVGTLGHIAPEQLEGSDADVRSDIFALGTVLYEMLAGRKAFEAKSHAGMIAAVLEHDPPSLSTLDPTTPQALERVVTRCLIKNPEKRWQDALDLANELKWIAQELPQTALLRPPRATGHRTRLALLGLPVALAAFGAGVFWSARQTPPPAFWTGAMLGGPSVSLGARISPDGRMLAVQAMVNGLTQVAVMKPETGNWMVLTHERQRVR